MTKIEIMSPAGSFASLHSAIKAGANSVYFGIGQLNMRARSANNFQVEDLEEITKLCRQNNVKTYLTVNTVLYDEDLEMMKKICDTAKKTGITAIIACDISAMQYARSIGLEVHISTQQNVSNIEAVKFFAKFADVIVLARELNIEQIKNITKQIEEQNITGPNGNLIEIEIFVHGALCVAISGKCYMSLATQNSSANRGACTQICRRSYRVTDTETGSELEIDNKYIMSPKDLCTIGYMDKILDAGVKVLKIEGRGRTADYVSTVTKCYRQAADAVENNTYTKDKIEKWIEELKSVYNRGFWHGGYYLGAKLGEWSGIYGSKATKENHYIGKALHYFKKPNIGEFVIETGSLLLGEEIIITGNTTGALKFKLDSLYVDEKEAREAKKGDVITIKVPERVRKNDKLFVVRKRE
jgi:putative protease